ncbi:dephospho-CoA kinase [Ferrimonas gelatinilytica]
MSHYWIGLTGGIGSGKTQVSNAFADLGITVVDTDLIAREVVAPGTPGLAAIADHFGPEVLHPDGSLDRAKLRQRVFADEQARQWLNQLTHPLIREAMLAQCRAATSPYVIVVVPLLAEGDMQPLFQRILVVDVPESVQITRTSVRDGNDIEQVKRILARQASRKQRLAIADDVIDNSGTKEALKAQLLPLHQFYLDQAEKANVAGIRTTPQ